MAKEQLKKKYLELLKDNYEPKDNTKFKKRRKNQKTVDNNDLTFYFQMIPLDLHQNIISYVPFFDIFKNISKVCKFWNQISLSEQSYFWNQTSIVIFASHRMVEKKFFEKFKNLKDIKFEFSIPCLEWLKNNSKTIERLELKNSNVKDDAVEFWKLMSNLEQLKSFIVTDSSGFLLKIPHDNCFGSEKPKLTFQSLSISNCTFTDIQFQQLINLFNQDGIQHLYLTNCPKVSGEFLKTLGDANIHLSSLSISSCSGISTLKLKEYCFLDKNLRVLDLSGLKSFPKIPEDLFEATPKLLKLSLKNNGSFASFIQFLNSISCLKSLKELDISQSFIYGVDIDETKMHMIRRNNPSLTYLTTNEGRFEIFNKKFYEQ
eukprot:gene4613-7995_t